MKYLNRREDFLNKSKYTKIENLIKEEAGTRSGPFENDIPWGDSLLGRLIMATIRKASIGINIMSIKRLIPRLTDQFNEILESCKISEDSKKDVARVLVFELLKKLKNAVDAEKDVDILISLTDETISNVNSSSLAFDDNDGKRNKLLDELDEWKKFLLSLGDTVETEKEEEVKPTNVNTQEIPFDFCIKNLKALNSILLAYKRVKDISKQVHISKKDSTGQEVKTGQEYTYNGKKVRVINLEHPQKVGGDQEWLTDDDVTSAEDIVYPKDGVFVIWPDVKNSVGKALPASKLVPITESTTPVVPVKQISILSSIKKVYDFCIQRDTDIFKDLEQFFKMSPENQKIPKFKNPILKIYNTARLNEDLNIFLSKPEDIGKSLITLYKSTKVKEDGSFEGIQDDMKLAIVDFNKTMKNILLFQSGVKEKDTETVESEDNKETESTKDVDDNVEDLEDNKNLSTFTDSVKLLKYNTFIKINELVDDNNNLETSVPNDSKVQKIKDYFYKNVDYMAFVMDKAEIDKIEANMENVQNDKLVLSIDPIIEILKLFNRAYKLHTTNVIPGGRTGGAVSRSVYNEYTPLGSSSGGVSGTADGPYRNNKTFNVWEDAVLDILKQTKYQPIFSKDTKIQIGNKLVEGAGTTFRKLITNLLDGEKLYKDGAQKKFLNEYFGPDAVTDKTQLGIGNDTKTNATNAADIKTTELSFIKNSDLTTNEDIKSGKFTNKILQVKGKEGDEDRIIYIFVEGMTSEYINISYCTSIYFFKKYIDDQGSVTIKDFNKIISARSGKPGDYLLRYSKIKIGDFKKLLINTKVELNSIAVDGKTIQKGRVIQPNLVSWLGNDTDKSLYSIRDVNRLAGTKSSVGGSRNVPELVNKKYGENNDFEPISKVVE